jgi:hypothetical protein
MFVDINGLAKSPGKGLLPNGFCNGFPCCCDPNTAPRKLSFDINDHPVFGVEDKTQKIIFRAAYAFHCTAPDGSRLISNLFAQKIH